MFYAPTSLLATITAGTSQSDILAVGGLQLLDLVVPAPWDAANITLLGSLDGITFFPIHDAAGAEVTLTAAAGRVVRFPAEFFVGVAFLRLRSGTTAAPVNQTAQRVVHLRARQAA
jgi:hypothetical protein